MFLRTVVLMIIAGLGLGGCASYSMDRGACARNTPPNMADNACQHQNGGWQTGQ